MTRLSIRGSVGFGGKNDPDDIGIILDLFRIRRGEAWYHGKIGTLSLPARSDGAAIDELGPTLKLFQKAVQELAVPDGLVDPVGNTILFLGGVRSSGKQIIVDLADQVLYAYDGSVRIHAFDCTSGDSDHKTAQRPSIFEITRKEKTYRSRKYDAQMNYALFFSEDGKAIHQSNAVGLTSFLKSWGVSYFGSHGCLRLAENDASKLFSWAASRTPIFIDLSRKTFQ